MIGFREFVQQVRGFDPYPWQQRLAEALAAETPASVDAVPELWITAPTGSGKTTTIDAAVWALASQADRAPVDRTVGVRLIWTIDRRLLVDQVFTQATALAARLDEALHDRDDPLREVAERLLALAAAGRWDERFDAERAITAGFAPLATARWRGGVPTSLEHRSPFQPTVITSTVQQVGSRLLFRGYGVSLRSRPVEAALVARDAMVFLDEAHLAQPFSETVQAVARHQRASAGQLETLPRPLRLATLTATPPASARGNVFALDAADRARPDLRARLTAPKTLRLVDSEAKPAAQASELVELAVAALDRPVDDAPVIVGVVANRVRTATDAYARIHKVLAARDDNPAVALLIGPQRPADRRNELREVWPWLFDGERPARPVVVVATQTFEVGLDADVTHLVTQSASAAALVQRFGRVNRAGTRPGATIEVVRDEGFPLYRDDEPPAWEWLEGIASTGGDLSVAALSDDESRPPARLPGAPTLTDGIVQQLAQTSSVLPPLQEPDVDGLLRGAAEELVREVTIAWRADLAGDPVKPFSPAQRRRRRDLIALAPPRPDECLTLPIARVRELLGRQSGAERRALDQPDVAAPAPEAVVEHERVLPFVVVRGRDVLDGVERSSDAEQEIDPAGLQPGDVVVLPTEAGGIDRSGLRPGVAVATDCRLEFDEVAGPDLPFVRLTRETLLGTSADEDVWAACVTAVRAKLDDENRAPALARSAADWLAVVRAAALPPESLEQLERTLGEDQWAARPLDRPDAADLGGLPPRRSAGWVLRRVPADVSAEEHARLEVPSVDDHCRAVAERAGGWADALGTTAGAAAAVRLAGLAHDLGKCDPRTQAFFSGGVRRIGRPAIAKSVFGTRDPARARAARHAAGLPSHLRHELASVAALASALDAGKVPEIAEVADSELALHLVGTHHGWGRPDFPLPVGGAPPLPFAAEAGGIAGTAIGDGDDGWQHGEWDRRFWRLHDELGPWALAYLEALLRLADRTVSEEGR